MIIRMVEEALTLRDAGIGQIRMSEAQGRAWRNQPPVSPLCEEAPHGFDFGNSRSRSRPSIFGTRRSSSGPVPERRALSQQAKPHGFSGLAGHGRGDRTILAGSADRVSLVAVGDNGIRRSGEDELFAIHLRNRLEGRPGDADAIRRLIVARQSG